MGAGTSIQCQTESADQDVDWRPGNDVHSAHRVIYFHQSPKRLFQLRFSRQRVSSFVITSNRAEEEWLGLFDDPILDNSALGRLANAGHQIVIESTSYRERLSPHRKLLGAHMAVWM